MKNILFFTALVLLVNACCSSSETISKQGSDKTSYKKIAEKNFKNDYKTIFNNDSTYLIIVNSPKNVTKEIYPPLKFLIYDLNNGKIIFQDNLTNGKAEWISNQRVKVSTSPEIVKGRDEENKEMFGYVYDVHARRKLSSQDNSK